MNDQPTNASAEAIEAAALGTTHVGSASDQRVVNNVMRHEYRVLGDGEKAQMQALKDKGLEFINLLHLIGGSNIDHAEGFVRHVPDYASRELQLAAQKAEEAVMWAVKHITR